MMSEEAVRAWVRDEAGAIAARAEKKRPLSGDELKLARLGLAAIVAALFLGGSLLSWVMSPSTPTMMEQCAKLCSGHVKSWTDRTPGHREEDSKGMNVHFPEQPQRCECAVTP